MEAFWYHMSVKVQCFSDTTGWCSDAKGIRPQIRNRLDKVCSRGSAADAHRTTGEWRQSESDNWLNWTVSIHVVCSCLLQVAKEVLDDQFNTEITGPWMDRWEVTHHNRHTDAFGRLSQSDKKTITGWHGDQWTAANLAYALHTVLRAHWCVSQSFIKVGMSCYIF